MRCLYCGKEVALFKRLRGGEFCSEAHRQKYQEEYTELALHRLALANASKHTGDGQDGHGEAKSKELFPAESDSPALSREIADRSELAAPSFEPFMPASTAPFAISANHEPEDAPAPHVPEPEPTPVAIVEESPSPAMQGFMATFIVPSEMDSRKRPDSVESMASSPAPSLPRLGELHENGSGADLAAGSAVELPRFNAADVPSQPIERDLELRVFVRGVPQVEVPVQSAVESGFEPVDRPLDVEFDAAIPEESPRPWIAPEADFPALCGQAEILLGDLARLDFELTAWGESAEGETEDEAPAEAEAAAPAAEAIPEVEVEPEPLLGPACLDPAAVQTVIAPPAAVPTSRPEPVHFDPVHINPVFMERIAGSPQLQSAVAPEVEIEPEAEVHEPEAVSSEPAVEIPAEPTPAEPAPAPLPPVITKPMPVTLHGLAPTRGKAVQTFTSAVTRTGAPHIPRESGLPLRPLMVLGPAPKAAAKPEAETAAPPRPAGKSIPIPERREPRPETAPRRSDVRVMPMPVKEQPAKAEPRPEPLKPAAAAKSEPVRESPAAFASKESPVPKESPALKEAAAPKETAPAEARPAKAPVEIRAAAPASTPAPKKPAEAPSEDLDLLGLPKLAMESQGGAWSRMSGSAKLIAIGAVLALIIGAVVLTSRGSGSAKTAAAPSSGPVLVEGPALANDAGWTQDWFADRSGSQNRHVDVLRGSLALRDYRLLFEGTIEQGALGWVFRGNNKSFYVEKIQVVTPGLNPMVALVRFAVINGKEQPRMQMPLAIQAHLDTMYKVRMDVVGNHFTTWVQDEKVDEWTDDQLEAGGVGLYYENGDSAKLRDTLHVIPLQRK